ncbi:MAG: MBL fold metallo-hydrolase [Candidatus Marinimicrobia bacterium]|jgi:glyoxylase-like metal-dependent hydrolase (beta-lactamase superfamily II)|nr:MBL fold metallo-hydrolase [Candidatus Neomarinimicrobiota bacterium]MBT5538109.1 MBL fold metallo-hydrolase [Candidatus Neomarinimicrobiota bacterium]
MQIRTFQGGYDNNLSYLIWCDQTRVAALIDASVEVHPIWDVILEEELLLDKILITHSHRDHISYLNDILDFKPLAKLYGFHDLANQFNNEQFHGVHDYDVISVGKHLLTVLHTPGHLSDCLCFWHQNLNMIFTGDTMFVGRTGRTIGPDSNIFHLYNSVYKKLLTLKPATIVYPGHHYGFQKSISIGENIRLSNFFSCNSFEEFKIVMEKFEHGRGKKE